MKRMIWIAILLTLMLAVASMASPAIERPPDGQGVFLVVLGGKGEEPDYAAMGGRVLQSWSDRRLVVMPHDSLATLKEHARVKYVQRVWTGEDDDAAPLAEQSSSAAVRADAGPTPPAWSSTYAYDPSGNVQSITKHNETHEYAYDPVNRLKQAMFYRGTPVTEQIQQYSYDPYGNLVGIGDRPIFVSPSTNHLTGALITYDNAGRLTGDADGRQYRYDGTGMNTLLDMPAAVAVDGDRRMIYTADDERIAIASATRMTYRVRDFGAHVLREWTSTNGQTLEWERDYIYAGNSLVAGEVQIDKRQNGMRHYHPDHLGSTRMVTNGAAELVSLHDYYPFGDEFAPTTTEFDNTGKAPRDFIKFTGHERDYLTVANDDGDVLDYMHARFYSPKWGRFLSVDPVLDTETAAKEPQRWNRYSYVINNPLKGIDPDGKDVILVTTYDGPRTGSLGHSEWVFQDSKGNWYGFQQGTYDSGLKAFFGLAKAGVDFRKVGGPEFSSNDMAKEYENRYQAETAILRTTPQEDAKIFAAAQDSAKSHNSGKQNYSLLTNNCGQAGVSILKKAGFTGAPNHMVPNALATMVRQWFQAVNEGQLKKDEPFLFPLR